METIYKSSIRGPTTVRLARLLEALVYEDYMRWSNFRIAKNWLPRLRVNAADFLASLKKAP